MRNIFTRAADVIVQASSLNDQVQTLTGKVQTLMDQVDRLTRQNSALEESLMQSREARTRAVEERDQALHAKAAAEADASKAKVDLEHYTELYTKLQAEHVALRKERDDYAFKHLEAEERATKTEQSLSDIRDFARDHFGLREPAMPPSQDAPPVTDAPAPADQPWWATSRS